jgi:phosphoenolpyruvate-protein kinase (PTS system EI component)
MAASAIPSVKALLRKLTRAQSQEIAQQCLHLPNLQRVREFLRSENF